MCTDTGTLLIFDEIQTGVGRTGTFSVAEQYDIVPDLVTLAKSLGSGIPVGATLVHDDLLPSIEYGDQGSTFGGGMIAMAAVEATLQTIIDDGLMSRAPEVFHSIQVITGAHVRAVRGRGCLIGLDFGRPCAGVLSALRDNGVLAGGSGDPNVMRLMPPLITTEKELSCFADAFEESVTQHH